MIPTETQTPKPLLLCCPIGRLIISLHATLLHQLPLMLRSDICRLLFFIYLFFVARLAYYFHVFLLSVPPLATLAALALFMKPPQNFPLYAIFHFVFLQRDTCQLLLSFYFYLQTIYLPFSCIQHCEFFQLQVEELLGCACNGLSMY
jgi:hypothetical protein